MKLLFLTLVNIENINDRNLYTDLMRKFRDEGHDVYIVTPSERRLKRRTCLQNREGITFLNIKTLNVQKTNLIEKGVSTLLIEHQFLYGIKKYLSDVRFDLVLYSTPPITFTLVIGYIKKKDGAKSYLLLKDIFPQNAVDLGMIKKGGVLHRYFRSKEKQLYHISDFIGCMSPANVEYLLKHNSEIDPAKVEVNPNSIEPATNFISTVEKEIIRKQYGIPDDSVAFIYGGNLGKPQGIDFLLDVLKSNKDRKDIFFVLVGSGTEFGKIKHWFTSNNPLNALLLAGMQKIEYDQLLQSCDVGLIFLDRRFTIPNFPSRLLSYLQFKLPVIAATDLSTDLGRIIEKNNFGHWAESGDIATLQSGIDKFRNGRSLIKEMGENGNNYLYNYHAVFLSYKIIMDRCTYKPCND